MSNSSSKDLAFIVSGGQTATAYLGYVLGKFIPDAHSVHEPDLSDGLTLRTLNNLREFNLWQLMLGRYLRRSGIRNIAHDYMSGTCGFDETVRAVRQQRDDWHAAQSKPFIIAIVQWIQANFSTEPLSNEQKQTICHRNSKAHSSQLFP